MTTADPTALGIDADADLYEILGVSKDATLQVKLYVIIQINNL
jgi:hypothetical protein